MSAVLGYLVLLLLPVGAVAWIVWRHRRKAGDTEARRREREAALVEMIKQRAAATTPPTPPIAAVAGTGTAGGPAAVPTPLVARADVPATTPEAVPVPAIPAGRRDRFLSHSETLVYLLLRTGIPEHEIFPRASLASVIADLPPAAENAVRAAAKSHDLDFVVCDKRMRIVAAIQVAGRLPESERRHVEESLAAAGIRLVSVDLKALPKREELAARVLGQAG